MQDFEIEALLKKLQDKQIDNEMADDELASSSPSPVSTQMLGLDQPNSTPAPQPQLSKEAEMMKMYNSLPAQQPKPQKQSQNLSSPKEMIAPMSLEQALPQGFSNNTVDALNEAQKKADDMKNMAQISKLINSLGAGISGAITKVGTPTTQISDNFAKFQEEKADQSVKDFKDLTEKEKDDPKSTASANFREFARPIAEKLGIALPETVSYNQIDKALPQLRAMYDSKETNEARKEAARFRQQEMALNRETRQDTKDLLRQDRKEKEAKLSDKQVESINEFDDSLGKMEGALAALGKNTNWTGPVDGRIPDILTKGDQVAFRSAVGRMQDSYRKLITGAGASNQELARLESRLPQPTDTYENFQAKAKAFMDEIKKAKASHLNNFAKVGKNVTEFKDPSMEQSSTVKVSNGKETLMIDRADLADAVKDGYKEVK